MEDKESVQEEKTSAQQSFILSLPFLQTQCQRDGLFYGILGGMGIGLVSFLFTSNPKLSTKAWTRSFVVITLGYTTVCLYKDYKVKKELKLIRRAMYEASLGKKNPTDLQNKVDSA